MLKYANSWIRTTHCLISFQLTPLLVACIVVACIFVETPSQMRLKNQLERRLGEIEEAKKIFSRPKVLVKA